MLRVEHIAKRFGPVTALEDVNLHLKKGEVLGLLGDNGAGKSTLIKILCGFQKADEGKMFLHGKPYEPKSVDDAREAGIETVYQDLALIDELSVYHNLFLRKERVHKPLPLLSNRQMKKEAREALDEIGINIPRIDVSVARLSGGQRQAIAVARTVNSDADIILLDEPLAAMGVKEGAKILDLVARLKAEGKVSIIMILHNYVQVFESCDRVSLIQQGAITLDKPTSETSVEELTELVVSEYRRAREESHREDAQAGPAGRQRRLGRAFADELLDVGLEQARDRRGGRARLAVGQRGVADREPHEHVAEQLGVAAADQRPARDHDRGEAVGGALDERLALGGEQREQLLRALFEHDRAQQRVLRGGGEEEVEGRRERLGGIVEVLADRALDRVEEAFRPRASRGSARTPRASRTPCRASGG